MTGISFRPWVDADPMEGLALRHEFEGTVQLGGRYVLVDDVTSSSLRRTR
jgi:hypothetical protein